MMLRTLFLKTIYDQRKMLLWWALGFVAVSQIYVAGYKTYADAGILDTELPETLGILMGAMEFGTAVGYLNSVFFTLIGAVLMVILSLVLGARAVAADEESGMLDLFLAHPMSRTHFVLQRFAALAAAIGLVGLVITGAIILAAGMAQMGVPAGNIVAACVGLCLLGLVIGSIALAVGALTGRSSLALGISAGLAVAGFLANNMAPMFQGLEFVQKLSPFYYYLGGNPLGNGFDLGGFGVLGMAALALAGLAVWGINRRDLAV